MFGIGAFLGAENAARLAGETQQQLRDERRREEDMMRQAAHRERQAQQQAAIFREERRREQWALQLAPRCAMGQRTEGREVADPRPCMRPHTRLLCHDRGAQHGVVIGPGGWRAREGHPFRVARWRTS